MKINFAISINTLLTAALGLIMSPLAPAANVKISALPFVISTPGTYVLTSNLVAPTAEAAAITINSALAGDVSLDFKGFSVSSPTPGKSSDSVGVIIFPNLTGSSITVRNGSIQGFITDVEANGLTSGHPPAYISNIHVVKMTMACSGAYNIAFTLVNSSSVSNCIFNAGPNNGRGIYDTGSLGGNTYNNNSFDGPANILINIGVPGGAYVLDRLSFEEPATN